MVPPTDIPNVSYSMLSPGVFVQAPVIPKVVLNAEAQFHLITNTGDGGVPECIRK